MAEPSQEEPVVTFTCKVCGEKVITNPTKMREMGAHNGADPARIEQIVAEAIKNPDVRGICPDCRFVAALKGLMGITAEALKREAEELASPELCHDCPSLPTCEKGQIAMAGAPNRATSGRAPLVH